MPTALRVIATGDPWTKTSEERRDRDTRRRFETRVHQGRHRQRGRRFFRRLSVPHHRPVVPGLLAQAGVSERLLTLNVNGQQRRVDVSKQETLAWTLRYKLGLTGTKLGCDRAECGACTVLIDDIPALFLLSADPHRTWRQSADD